ncbi:MAG: PEGA domain-containing protein [Alphaproteobacteria bacterium]|nr:PEGA domain-containing protein [Alphaproteobacteria bacterium]
MNRIPLFLLMLLSSTSTALAARLPELAVVGVHVEGVSEEDGQEAAARLGESIAGGDTVEVVLPDYVSARLKGREALVIADMALAVGKAQLEEGRVLYERAQPDAAIPQLQKAVEELTEGIASTGSTKDLIEAYLVLALAHNGLGEDEPAREAFRQVVVLDPARELDPISYPPRVIDQFNAVRAEVLAQGTATVDITAPLPPPPRAQDGEDAPPPVAQVMVDGRGIGEAPLRAEGLPPGMHHVWASAEGGLRGYAQLSVEPDQAQSIQLDMLAGQLEDPSQTTIGRSRQTERLYTALGEYCQTPLVLLAGRISEEEVAVQLYSTRTGNFSQPLTSKAGGDPVRAMEDLLPALAGYVTESGDIRSDRVSIDVAAFDVSTNAVLTKMLLDPDEARQIEIIEGGGARWWVWAGIGAIVAGGAGTTAALLLTNDEPKEEGVITVVIP